MAHGMHDNASRPAHGAALCIEHIGMSEKPIFPILIMSDGALESRCKQLLDQNAEFASVHVIPQVEMQKILRQNSQLFRGTKNTHNLRAYGTFRVTLLRGNRTQKAILTRDQFLVFKRNAAAVSADQRLKETLEETAKRLESPKQP